MAVISNENSAFLYNSWVNILDDELHVHSVEKTTVFLALIYMSVVIKDGQLHTQLD
jgi:hypothetical protein